MHFLLIFFYMCNAEYQPTVNCWFWLSWSLTNGFQYTTIRPKNKFTTKSRYTIYYIIKLLIQWEIPLQLPNGKKWIVVIFGSFLQIMNIRIDNEYDAYTVHEYCLQNIGTKIREDKVNVTFYVYGKRTCEECTYP